jgi:hypothetical protein
MVVKFRINIYPQFSVSAGRLCGSHGSGNSKSIIIIIIIIIIKA